MQGTIKVISRCPQEDDLYRYAERTLPENSLLYPVIALHLRHCERCQKLYKEYVNREIH